MALPWREPTPGRRPRPQPHGRSTIGLDSARNWRQHHDIGPRSDNTKRVKCRLHRKCGRSDLNAKVAPMGGSLRHRVGLALEREAVIRPLTEQERLSTAALAVYAISCDYAVRQAS